MSNIPSLEMFRHAEVEVEGSTSRVGKNEARILVNGAHEHIFPSSSRVSKALRTSTPDEIADRLQGGSYFFVDGNLHSFRDGNYSGFVHTDEAINELANVVGVERMDNRSVQVHDDSHGSFNLGKKWSDSPISVPNYSEGGEFNSELHFAWSPFVRTVNSAFMLYRLICTNGMRGLRSFMSTRVPLENRFEEHLEIANRQIQNKINGVVSRRLGQMGNERASVGELQRVSDFATKRLTDGVNISDAEVLRLHNIMDASTPELHLDGIYRDNVFKDKALADQHPGHMSVFDVYNMATEIRSHTGATESATPRSLDMFANDLVFDRKDITQRATRFNAPSVSSFSDPDRAFFGK
jgi:hypothetical protein